MRALQKTLTTTILSAAVLAGSASAQNDNGRGRHKQLSAVPTPHSTDSGQAGKVVIDGKLDD